MIPYNGIDLDFSLNGKVAVITGGAAGIGHATAKFFVEKGVKVVLADLSPNVGQIAKELGGQAIGVEGNVTDQAFSKAVIEAATKAFGQVDILVNSAGIAILEAAKDTSVDSWNKTIDVNLSASFFMAQAIGGYMIENGIKGSIVNLASQAGVIALDKHVAYCASKGAIISMTQVLALEWGRHGIRVNAVSPTVVLTELGHKAWDGPVGDAFKSQMPSERFAQPEEIAACVGFLCSRAAAMITGHNLLIDGGFTIK